MGQLKHLPVNEWPEADREAFRAAYEPGDVFDETAGPGAHLSQSKPTTVALVAHLLYAAAKLIAPTTD